MNSLHIRTDKCDINVANRILVYFGKRRPVIATLQAIGPMFGQIESSVKPPIINIHFILTIQICTLANGQ